MLEDPELVVLHIAERAAEFEEGHVPGARFVRFGDFAVAGPGDLGAELAPVEQLDRLFESVGVSDDSRVVLYGNGAVEAARAFFTLDALGHARVLLLDGGLRAWRADAQAIETGSGRPPAHGRFTPRLNAAKVVDAAFIQRQMAADRSGAIALIDVRPDPEFLGTDGGQGGALAAGHIAGARQLPWGALVGPDGRFLPADALRSKLHAAGAVPDKPVVSYCMVGMRASVVYFVARHLGYDARLYDGSIVDWSLRGLPVRTGRP
jgi:thiosulfate/3-mercaptopyruvate sulfurtransferase